MGAGLFWRSGQRARAGYSVGRAGGRGHRASVGGGVGVGVWAGLFLGQAFHSFNLGIALLGLLAWRFRADRWPGRSALFAAFARLVFQSAVRTDRAANQAFQASQLFRFPGTRRADMADARPVV